MSPKPLQFTPQETIVFEGDSMTSLRIRPALDQWPWLRISNNHRSWADVFSELLFAWRPDLKLSFKTTAIGGSTCRDMKERFGGIVPTLRPAHIFLTLGTNDANHKIPTEEFDRTLRECAAKAAEWGGEMVFVTGFPADPGADAAAVAKVEARRAYDAVQFEMARTLPNVRIVDLNGAFTENMRTLHGQWAGHAVYGDGLHLSHLGAIMVAGEVLKACGFVRQGPA